MHILIIGAAGMVGRKLTAALVRDGQVGGKPIERFTFADVFAAPSPDGFTGAVESVAVDVTAPGIAETLIAKRPDLIFHLAAIVSGEAEADFEKGYRINLDGTRYLLEAIRLEGAKAPYKPRLIFTSSIAVFGAPFPDAIGDEFFTTPLTSYGTQKAIGELLVNDYSRRGYIDGRSLRLPIIAVRGGAPSTATSAWASDIVREPLSGNAYASPVEPGDRGYLLSPRRCIEGLITGHDSPAEAWGRDRAVMMAGLACSAADLVAAVARIGGQGAADLVRWQPDPFIRNIVTTWPSAFRLDKATRIGLVADASVDEIVRNYVEDDSTPAGPVA
ncbi:MAG: NAD-dependent epimerase/dehydratase family protein [Pseudomonadota bacterium]|nr:NAD-dependent epimerase/dehydratase family protein [Pseudomonadota bacterium]